MVGLGESTLLNQPDLRIRLEDVHIAFGSNQVLRGVHLGVQRGDTLVVVGRSGEGKSVLLKHIVALQTPDLGAVWIDDYPVDTVERSLLTMIRK